MARCAPNVGYSMVYCLGHGMISYMHPTEFDHVVGGAAWYGVNPYVIQQRREPPMTPTTKAQRATLKWKWEVQNHSRAQALWPPLTYRSFRRSVEGLIGGNGCIMVPWCGMWLGIETDGYAHT